MDIREDIDWLSNCEVDSSDEVDTESNHSIGFEIDEVFCCCEKVVGTVGFNQENQGPLEKSK